MKKKRVGKAKGRVEPLLKKEIKVKGLDALGPKPPRGELIRT